MELILFITDPTSIYSPLPTTGTDWTRVDFGGVASVFTKNGSTDAEGASFATLFVRSISSGSVYRCNGLAWVSNPDTTVSLWTPDPIIDWSGLTTSGTATLS
jgi:hypothetical protein